MQPYHECLATVVRLSSHRRATVVRLIFIKMVYVGTHDNVFIARQSHDCGKTLSRQPQDSDTIKNRRAKKVHVQFSSHDTRQRHDAKNIVRLSYDDHRWPAIWQNFMSWSCIDVSWVRCHQGLNINFRKMYGLTNQSNFKSLYPTYHKINLGLQPSHHIN